MLKDAPRRHVAVRVVFVQYDREKYRGALERLVSHLESLQELDYEVLVVDNARQGSWSHRASRRVLHIGGDNSAWEFSAFDRALALLDASHADCDAFVFVTDAFGAYGETFLELVKRDTFDRAVADNACIGWVDAWPAPCLLFGKEDN